MPALVELQSQLRSAVTGGEPPGLASLLTGQGSPARRLAIHRRHYETSLINALLQKFPATAWLVGTPLLTNAALCFVRAHPPTAPCIAEYGQSFPEFLSMMPETARFPYVRSFSELEWHLGQIAVAIDQPAVALDDLASVDITQLPDLTLRLQPGLRYLKSDWPIDELMTVFLSDCAPDSFALTTTEFWLELRGSRGEFSLSRLPSHDFAFRASIAEGTTVATAAQTAIAVDSTFDIAAAFSTLFAAGLVRTVVLAEEASPCK